MRMELWHCQMDTEFVSDNSKIYVTLSSVLHCSLLKIKTTFMIEYIFCLFQVEFGATIFYFSIKLLATLSVKCNDLQYTVLNTQYIWLKEENQISLVFATPFPDTSEKLGSNTAPVRHLNWLSFTRCGRRCGPWLDVKLDVRIPYICVLNGIGLGK